MDGPAARRSPATAARASCSGCRSRLRFALTGASANIYDLTAKLFVAPLNAAGQPGPERPAAGLPPGAGNLFYFLPIINQYAMLLDTRPLGVGRLAAARRPR